MSLSELLKENQGSKEGNLSPWALSVTLSHENLAFFQFILKYEIQVDGLKVKCQSWGLGREFEKIRLTDAFHSELHGSVVQTLPVFSLC